MGASVQAGLELAVAVGLAAIGLFALAISVTMGNPLNQPIGPGYVPACLAVLIMVLSVWNVAGCYRRVARQLHAPPQHKAAQNAGGSKCERSWLTAAGLLVVSLLLWNFAGCVAGLVAATFALIWADRKIHTKVGLPFAVVLTLSMWLLFQNVLKVDLG